MTVDLLNGVRSFCPLRSGERISQSGTALLRKTIPIEVEFMDGLRTLRTFISVAEHRSFAEAGRRLSLSPTTVSRSIAALEINLGVRLLRRTTGSVSLSDEGALFTDHFL